MDLNQRYRAQVELMLQVLPILEQVNINNNGNPIFALKGGTAINLFVRDMPRLSVDIDLAYLPIQERSKSLLEIGDCLAKYAIRIKELIFGVSVHEKKTVKDKRLNKLLVQRNEAVIKIEPNEILRGSVFAPEELELSPAVENEFGLEMSLLVSSFADINPALMIFAKNH